jgi:hypothetical protein
MHTHLLRARYTHLSHLSARYGYRSIFSTCTGPRPSCLYFKVWRRSSLDSLSVQQKPQQSPLSTFEQPVGHFRFGNHLSRLVSSPLLSSLQSISSCTHNLYHSPHSSLSVSTQQHEQATSVTTNDTVAQADEDIRVISANTRELELNAISI